MAEILRLGAAKTCGKLSLREIMVPSKFPDSPRIGHGKIPPAPRLDVKRKAEKCGKTYFITAAARVIAALFGGCGEQSERNLQSPSREPLGADKKRRALGRPARAFSCGGNVKNFGSGKSRLQGGPPMVQYNVA